MFVLPFYVVFSVAFGSVHQVFRQPLPYTRPWWWSFAMFNETLSKFYSGSHIYLDPLIRTFEYVIAGRWTPGLYLKRQLGATDLQTAIAFVAFSAAVAVGRLFTGRVLFGLGRKTTIIASGTGGMVGGVVAALTSDPALVAFGFLSMGASIAAAAPAGFGLVETLARDDQAHAIAAVTTVGYSGFVWSPPIFAWLAGAFDLRAAMGVIVSATVGIVIAGPLAPSDRPVATAEE